MTMPRTIVAPNPSPMTLDGTRTFILGRERPVVIDPGPDDPAHLAAILAALGEAAPISILLTHSHADHAALAPELAERTGAPVLMGRGALRPVLGSGFVTLWIGEGHAVETDAGPLTVHAAPGHAPEHVVFLWKGEGAPEGGALFVGDTFMGQGDTTLVAPPEGDLAAYLRTLNRIEALGASILYPAHGPEIADARAAVERYRAHRMERIGQVVRALRATGPARAGEIVDAVYGAALDPRLKTAAEGSLTAILGYLTSEGRAEARPDGTYVLTESR